MRFLTLFKRFDWALVLPPVFLSSLGLVSIYSSSLSRGDFLSFKKQIAFFIIALVCIFLLNLFDLRFLKTNSRLVFGLYIFSLFTLFGLFFFGKQIRGLKGWYQIGPVSFAPVSFAAIVLIIFLSKYFSTRHIEIQRFKPILLSGLYVSLPVIMVLLQPDLGSALALIAIWFGALIFSGIKMRHFFILGLIFLICFIAGWQFWLKDYQKQRILSFLNPAIDEKGVSWSVNQSRIAIGAGGFWGKGIGKGTQTQYGFLTEPKTDFTFAAIAEETGFLGIFLMNAALFFLFWRLLRIIFQAQSNFLRLFASGFAFLILSQSFINMGMCLGLLPVIGIPLPFVNYSGSQLLSFYMGLGILMGLKSID